MPERSKGRSQPKCSAWSSRLGVRRWANNPIPEKSAVTKPWKRPRPTQDCSASQELQNYEISPITCDFYLLANNYYSNEFCFVICDLDTM
jgi:hypothetical protein